MFDFVYRFLNKIGYSHPIHPTQVHIPMGLVVGALIFALVALVFHRERLRFTPRQCVILAFIWVFPSMLLGLMDWQHFYGGAWLFEIKVKLIVASLLTIFLFLAILLGHKYGATSKATLFVYFLCFCSVIVLGFFGGQLVFEGRTSGLSRQFDAGQKVFVANCSSCHPNGENILKPNLPLKGAPQLTNFETFSAFIQNPKMPDGSTGIMPPFPLTKIPGQEARNLYEYIVNVLDMPKG